jgi:CRP/FNR family transcriptional regulator
MVIETKQLESIPYFSGLSPTELEKLKQHVFEKTVSRNDLIIMEGEPAEAVYFVISGAVKAFKTSAEGKEQILYILRHGDSFNDVPMFDGGPNPASAVAMTPVKLCGIGKAEMEAILREHPDIARNAVRILAEKARHFVSLVEDLSFRHVTSRVAKLLLEYAGDHRGAGGEVKPRLTQQDMAAMAGTAREVVGRSLKSLEEEGAIKVDRHRIVIVNKGILEDMSGVSV